MIFVDCPRDLLLESAPGTLANALVGSSLQLEQAIFNPVVDSWRQGLLNLGEPHKPSENAEVQDDKNSRDCECETQAKDVYIGESSLLHNLLASTKLSFGSCLWRNSRVLHARREPIWVRGDIVLIHSVIGVLDFGQVQNPLVVREAVHREPGGRVRHWIIIEGLVQECDADAK